MIVETQMIEHRGTEEHAERRQAVEGHEPQHRKSVEPEIERSHLIQRLACVSLHARLIRFASGDVGAALQAVATGIDARPRIAP